MKNPHVDMIAHPTGRIIGQRDGYNPDVPHLIEWAKEYGKILELNANPYRLDLATEYLKMAQEEGVPIAINTDAHAYRSIKIYGYRCTICSKSMVEKKRISSIHGRLKSFKQLYYRNNRRCRVDS